MLIRFGLANLQTLKSAAFQFFEISLQNTDKIFHSTLNQSHSVLYAI